MVAVGRLPTLVTLLAQDRYYDAHFLLGRVKVKVGGSLIIICYSRLHQVLGAPLVLMAGFVYRYPVPLT